MRSDKEDISNSLVTILFMVFFFFFAIASSNKSDYQTSNTLTYSLQHELESGYYSSHFSAVIVDCVQLPAVLKNCLDVLPGSDLNFCNQHLRISGDNKKIAQSIKSFQKTRLKIEPLPIRRFYFHLTSTDTEDFPVLS